MVNGNKLPLQKVHLVAVDLGYGHQRAAFPLRFLAKGQKMILANNYVGIPQSDMDIWNQGRRPYEFISRAKHIPLLGDILFWGMDQIQRISNFYPRRNLFHPSLQLETNIFMIRKKAWGKHLIKKLNKDNLPLLTTFFTVAYMAEEFGYQNDIYLIVCDADVSRAWASPQPVKSKIKYLVPTKRVYERLQLYGVPKRNIYYTGFPLPKENLGSEKLEIVKKDFAIRLKNLDPQHKYMDKYGKTVKEYLGQHNLSIIDRRILNITFAVGGAGAQREIGSAIVKSLKRYLINNKLQINLVAGIHKGVRDYFIEEINKIGLADELGKNVKVLYEDKREKYFEEFNKLMRKTDILWTKPSELSFYVALGIPIIISEPLGSQEKFNRKWLKNLGAGLDQEKVKYVDEWLMDWLNSGWLAEAAMQGFLEAPKFGTFNIDKIIQGNSNEFLFNDVILQY